jgi:TonB family protein
MLFVEHDEPNVPEGRVERVIVPFDRDFIRCQDDAAGFVGAPIPIGAGSITPPKKTRHVSPQYPASAQGDRIQGIVVIDAMISTTGCVERAKVTRSVDTRLDFAALQAVTQWRFTPTYVGQISTPVLMTITVAFTLN